MKGAGLFQTQQQGAVAAAKASLLLSVWSLGLLISSDCS